MREVPNAGGQSCAGTGLQRRCRFASGPPRCPSTVRSGFPPRTEILLAARGGIKTRLRWLSQRTGYAALTTVDKAQAQPGQTMPIFRG